MDYTKEDALKEDLGTEFARLKKVGDVWPSLPSFFPSQASDTNISTPGTTSKQATKQEMRQNDEEQQNQSIHQSCLSHEDTASVPIFLQHSLSLHIWKHKAAEYYFQIKGLHLKLDTL